MNDETNNTVLLIPPDKLDDVFSSFLLFLLQKTSLFLFKSFTISRIVIYEGEVVTCQTLCQNKY